MVSRLYASVVQGLTRELLSLSIELSVEVEVSRVPELEVAVLVLSVLYRAILVLTHRYVDQRHKSRLLDLVLA